MDTELIELLDDEESVLLDPENGNGNGDDDNGDSDSGDADNGAEPP